MPRRIRDLVYTSLRAQGLESDIVLAEDNLIVEYEATRGAVRGALQALALERVVSRQRRTGTRIVGNFVSIDLVDESIQLAAGSPVYQEIIEDECVMAPNIVRTVLDLPADEHEIRMVESTFLHDGVVIGVRSAYYSKRFLRHDFTEHSDVESLASFFKTEIADIESVIGASLVADQRTAELLGLEMNSSVIFRQQIYRAPDGSPIQVTFDHMRGDRVVITANRTL